eukprot:351489-Chlamydomonas_euryale.AAC.4
MQLCSIRPSLAANRRRIPPPVSSDSPPTLCPSPQPPPPQHAQFRLMGRHPPAAVRGRPPRAAGHPCHPRSPHAASPALPRTCQTRS